MTCTHEHAAGLRLHPADNYEQHWVQADSEDAVELHHGPFKKRARAFGKKTLSYFTRPHKAAGFLFNILLVISALVHGGMSYLGLVLLLGVIFSALAVGSGGLALIPLLAGLMALSCGLGALSLEVPTTQRFVRRFLRNFDRKFSYLQDESLSGKESLHIKIWDALPSWKSFFFYSDFVHKIIFSFKVRWNMLREKSEKTAAEATVLAAWQEKEYEKFLATKSLLHSDNNKKLWESQSYSRYLTDIAQKRSWLRVIFGPIISVFGPLAQGAEFWMGLLPVMGLIGLIGPGGMLLPAGIALCCVGFVVGATLNYAFQSQRALSVLDGGTHSIRNFVREIFGLRTNHLQPNGDRVSSTLTGPLNAALTAKSSADDDTIVSFGPKDKQYLVLCNQEGFPLLDAQGALICISDADWQHMQEQPKYNRNGKSILQTKAQTFLDDEGNPVALEDIQPLHATDGLPEITLQNGKYIPTLRSNGELALFKGRRNKEGALVWDKDAPAREKGFFEKGLPFVFGPLLWLIGPLVAGGTAYLGMLEIAFAPWMIPFGVVVALVFATQNLTLEGNASFELLESIGVAIDSYFFDIKNAYLENRGNFALWAALRKATPNLFLLLPDLISYPLYQLARLLIPSLRCKTLDDMDWLDAAVSTLFVSPLTHIVSILSPFAHAAEGMRGSQPIFIAIVGLIGLGTLTTVSTAFPPAMIAAVLGLSIVAAIVTGTANRGLEVPASVKVINEKAEQFKGWVRGIKKSEPKETSPSAEEERSLPERIFLGRSQEALNKKTIETFLLTYQAKTKSPEQKIPIPLSPGVEGNEANHICVCAPSA